MKRILAIALLLSSPATAQDLLALADAPEGRRLFEAYVECTVAAVERYTPVEPSAETIARAAHAACRDDWDRLRQYFLDEGAAQRPLDRMLRDLEAGIQDSMIRMVLDARVQGRQ